MEKIDVDNHKLMYHVDKVSEWQKSGDCFPIYIEFGLTNACNHDCCFCALDYLGDGRDFIDTDIMLSTLKQMSDYGVKSTMFAGEGEPTLHKDIGLFTKKAKEYGLDIAITTNGVPFTKQKIIDCLPNLSWIRFSIDAGTREDYAKVHGTNADDFEKVLKNITDSVNYKKDNDLNITIGAQSLMIPQSMNNAEKLASTLKKIGVDNLQVKPYSHHPSSNNDFVVDTKEYNKLEKDLMKYDSEGFKILFRRATAKRVDAGINYPKCYGLPFFALGDAKGNIIPCNLFYNQEDFTYGNLYKNSFSEIWKGDKRKNVLKKLDEKGVKTCRNGCRLDVMNRYLHRLKNPLAHDNFP